MRREASARMIQESHPQRVEIVVLVHLWGYEDALLDDVDGIKPDCVPR